MNCDELHEIILFIEKTVQNINEFKRTIIDKYESKMTWPKKVKWKE